MTTFLLVRHADNDSIGRYLAGWTPGVHLNERGRAQAEALAARLATLPLRAIYTSPLERARETAAPIAQRLSLVPQVLEEIGEVRMGEWTGLTMEELRQDPRWERYNAFRSAARIPGGESLIEVAARMTAILDCLRHRHPGETVLLVSHGDPIRAALCHYLGMPLDFLYRMEISPASLSILELSDTGAQVTRLNDTGE